MPQRMTQKSRLLKLLHKELESASWDIYLEEWIPSNNLPFRICKHMEDLSHLLKYDSVEAVRLWTPLS